MSPVINGNATTDQNDAHGIAQMMRLGHFRPVHVKSAEAHMIRTALQARRQVVDALVQVQGTIRGLLRAHGLKIGDVTATASTAAYMNCWRCCLR